MEALLSWRRCWLWCVWSCCVYNSGFTPPSSVDPYGFERSKDFDYDSYEALMSEYLVILTRRSIKWSKLLKGRAKVQKNVRCKWELPKERLSGTLHSAPLASTPSVKRYVRKGIPNEHRPLIWMEVSGAQDQLDKNPGYYQSLLEAHHDPKLVETIRTGRREDVLICCDQDLFISKARLWPVLFLDLNRTFPDNINFRKTSSPCLQKALFNVLSAYGHHNPSVGYCQVTHLLLSTSIFSSHASHTKKNSPCLFLTFPMQISLSKPASFAIHSRSRVKDYDLKHSWSPCDDLPHVILIVHS